MLVNLQPQRHRTILGSDYSSVIYRLSPLQQPRLFSSLGPFLQVDKYEFVRYKSLMVMYSESQASAAQCPGFLLGCYIKDSPESDKDTHPSSC